jgi:hypothetical protein
MSAEPGAPAPANVMKENFRRTDKPKKRRVSYEKESQATLREAIKKAHSRIVGDVPIKVAYGNRSGQPD